MNVLLTAVGRRSYLVRYFQEELKGRGKVIVTNSYADTPGMHVADIAQVVPPSHDPGYVDAIMAICRKFDVRLLCSCHDLDVLALSMARDHFQAEGIVAMLPDPDWARSCLDKFECGRRLGAAGFGVPWASVSLEETLDLLASGMIHFPLLVKARLGFGSLGLSRCDNVKELKSLIHQALNELRDSPVDHFLRIPPSAAVLIQEFLAGPERCVDVVNDLKGHYATHFICEVHAMRAGESANATTLDPTILGDLPVRLSKFTRHVGIWGVDVLMNDGNPKIIDLNPRFTGDYPFQHIAGANVPATLLAWCDGMDPDPAWLAPATGVSGFKDLVPTRIRSEGN
jgi:carbamoyl-phosphate synthase large subunit